jgi:hypothetical protein
MLIENTIKSAGISSVADIFIEIIRCGDSTSGCAVVEQLILEKNKNRDEKISDVFESRWLVLFMINYLVIESI